MMDPARFSEQDFLSDGPHWRAREEVVSDLVFGDPKRLESEPVCVAIPTYRRADLLREALQSCFSQDTNQAFSILITDNDPEPGGETERLVRELSDPRIVYYRNRENLGALGNFNRCLLLARTPYAVMLNTDDLLEADYLGRVFSLIQAHPDADLVFPDALLELGHTTWRPRGYQGIGRFWKRWMNLDAVLVRLHLNDFLLYNPVSSPSGTLYRLAAFRKSPGFNPDWHPSGDAIFYSWMAKRARVFLWPVRAVRYRFIGNITQESDMRLVFLWQRFLFDAQVAARGGRPWLLPFARGEVLFRCLRKKNRLFGYCIDRDSAQRLSGAQAGVRHMLFYLGVVAVMLLRFHGRLLRAAMGRKRGHSQ